MKAEYLWKQVLGELELQMTKATFNTWLKGSLVVSPREDDLNGHLVVGFQNQYALDWVSNRLDVMIEKTVEAMAGRSVAVTYQLIPENVPVAEAVALVPPEMPEMEGYKRPLPAKGEYGGNMPPEVRQKLVEKIAAREVKSEGKGKGEKASDNPVRFEETRRASHPLTGFVPITHYAIRFWQPYMEAHGRGCFALLTILSSYAYEVETYASKGPTLKQLAQKMGWGDKTTLRGRAASGRNQAKAGLVDTLRDLRICDHASEGKGRGQIQVFRYLTKLQDLPLLTHKQIATLSPDDQDEHMEWLRRHTAVAIEDWLKDDRESAILPFPDKHL